MPRNITKDLKKSVAFIGDFYKDVNGELAKSRLFGTGFLIDFNKQLYLVTAKHVVCDVDRFGNVLQEKHDLDFFTGIKASHDIKLPMKDDFIASGTPIDKFCIETKTGGHWYFDENPEVDLAIAKVIMEESAGLDLDTIPYNLRDNGAINETDSVFYISFQPGISDIENDSGISPIFRKGIVSRVNNDNTFFIDGFSSFGNSGSPVFKAEKNNANPFIGIVGSEIVHTITKVNIETGERFKVHEENTGLSHVWGARCIYKILEQNKLLIKSLTQKTNKNS